MSYCRHKSKFIASMMIGTELHFSFSELDVETTIIKWPLKKTNIITARRISDRNTKQNICHPKKKSCRGFWVMVSVFEHITQQLLHWSVSNGPVEEQQLYSL